MHHLHGHNWIIDVTCQREELDENGMVVDFGKIKEVVMALDQCVHQRCGENQPYGGKHRQMDPRPGSLLHPGFRPGIGRERGDL